MATVTIEIEDDEILVALKRGEGYEDVHPQLVTEDAIGDRWPEYRTIQFDDRSGSDTEMLDWIEDHVKEIRQSFSEHFEIDWIGPHGDCTTRGESLRDAVRKAMSEEK